MVIRRIRDGRVYYMLPGTEVGTGETPGAAAARAALDDLGVDVGVEETLYAQAFSGVDHFFFLAACETDVRPAGHAAEHDDFELAGEHAGSTRSRSCHAASCLRTTSPMAARPPNRARRSITQSERDPLHSATRSDAASLHHEDDADRPCPDPSLRARGRGGRSVGVFESHRRGWRIGDWLLTGDGRRLQIIEVMPVLEGGVDTVCEVWLVEPA